METVGSETGLSKSCLPWEEGQARLRKSERFLEDGEWRLK